MQKEKTAFSAQPFVVKVKEMQAHHGDLQSVVQQALKERGKYVFLIPPTRVGHGTSGGFAISLQAGVHTRTAQSDRGLEEDIACLCSSETSGKELWFSLKEHWIQPDRDKLQFIRVSFTFYLRFAKRQSGSVFYQAFRLEWEGRQEKPVTGDGQWRFPAKGAGHPHWQFDPWLTGSEDERTSLRRELVEHATDAPAVKVFTETMFEQNEHQSSAFLSAGEHRPSMDWFKRIHFPAVAMWHEESKRWEPKEITLPHARNPENLDQIVNWVYSAMTYVKDQFENYFDKSH